MIICRIWVGVSRTLDFKSLIARYIDPYFSSVMPHPYFSQAYFTEASDDEMPQAELVRSFGVAPFDPGDYEVYAGERYSDERFNYGLFWRFAPFAQSAPGYNASGMTN
ncbi:MAG: hypothetical protein J2P54_20245 [Bradyrhizobiaceae bacterium]|nr:hypothetical protein [Bradyrhizobiaceae bacterium]